ncbi:MAG TPA: hypothetical protein EYN66_07860 [Myxococcales bacterium]|nr:hypothetical protein [Myxococcales bacterium]
MAKRTRMTREERQTLKNDQFDRRLKVAHIALDAMKTPGMGTVITFLGIKGLNKVGVVNTGEAVGLQLIASMGTLGNMGPLGVAAVVVATGLQGFNLNDLLNPLAPLEEVGLSPGTISVQEKSYLKGLTPIPAINQLLQQLKDRKK